MAMIKTVSILDNTALHLPHLFSKGDRLNLSLDKALVTDAYLSYPLSNKLKFAWLVEPECVFPHSYNYIRSNYSKFNKVLTHDKEVLDSVPNSVFVPFGTTFIKNEDFAVYSKTKLISMVASGKNFTQGHYFRLSILNYARLRPDKIDLYGRQINPIDYKLDCLKDYMFSIAIENSKHDYWFTEKLLDCFLTGTIPIYWGCPSIDNFFDRNGIICFDTQSDLEEIIKNLSTEMYESKLESIRTNFESAKNYINTYDEVYKFCEEYNESK